MWSLPFVPRFYRAGTRKRLWMCATALGVFLLTIIIGNQFLPADKAVSRQMLGHDFLAFYTAGSFVRQNRADDLYNLDAVRDFEQATAKEAGLEVGKSFGPWWNPPFYALVFQPLAALPYARALDLWRFISVGAMLLAIALLASFVAQASLASRWQQWMLAPMLIVISMPFIQSFSHGQNTFTSLLLLTATVALWREKKSFIAGCLCGLLFYKPQLAAVVAAVMVIDLGATAMAGISLTGLVLLLVTLCVLPDSLGAWLHQLPANVHWMQVEHAYLWERHVTLKAFWRLLLQGREAGEAGLLTTTLTWITVAAIGGALAHAAFKRTVDDKVRRDRLIGATIVAMPLLMPFYFDYDLLLLAVPAVLYAAERIAAPDRTLRIDALLTTSWVVLFLWLFVNPAFAFHTHVSGSVILLSALAIGTIHRVNRADGAETPILIIRPQRVAIAA